MNSSKEELANKEVINGFEDVIELSPNAPVSEKETKLPAKGNILNQTLEGVHDFLGNFLNEYKDAIRITVYAILNLAYFVYFGFATKYYVNSGLSDLQCCDGYGFLIIITALFYAGLLYYNIVKPYLFPPLKTYCCKGTGRVIKFLWKNIFVKSTVYIALLVAAILFLVFDTVDDRSRFIPLIGLTAFCICGFIFSKHPGRIIWTPVMHGLIVQFALGLLTIRWEVGRAIFECVGNKISTFLLYTTEGSAFVFGDDLVRNQAVFVFQSLSVIYFLSFFTQILYYYGIMQKIVLTIGWFLQKTMGTTVCESVASASNIFIGMSETPLLLKPYLHSLTKSEIHAMMASGLASVSGSVMAAYISFGASPAHLLTASIMSAPAALCFSKLFYPETEISQQNHKTIKIAEINQTSVLNAASKGATDAIEIVLSIVANLIAFIALIAFIDGVLNWFASLVGLTDVTVELIVGKIFIPISWIMGVPWEECESVGQLIGIKTIINEFVAYQRFGEFKNQGLLSAKSQVIATYALCGFTNPGSIGITISTLGTLIPTKREEITGLAFRAYIAGSFICFMTACIAGMLVTEL